MDAEDEGDFEDCGDAEDTVDCGGRDCDGSPEDFVRVEDCKSAEGNEGSLAVEDCEGTDD